MSAVGPDGRDGAAPVTAMARALGVEIAGRLEALAAGGAPETIDLRSMPMSQADRAGLETLLGRGEVSASIEAAGRTEIRETALPGVWWLAHRDIHGGLLMEEIAVTEVPDILRADRADMTRGAARLAAELSGSGATGAARGAAMPDDVTAEKTSAAQPMPEPGTPDNLTSEETAPDATAQEKESRDA